MILVVLGPVVVKWQVTEQQFNTLQVENLHFNWSLSIDLKHRLSPNTPLKD